MTDDVFKIIIQTILSAVVKDVITRLINFVKSKSK
jgi:hypothetical protein